LIVILHTITLKNITKNCRDGREEPIEGRLKQCLEVIQRRALDNEMKKNFSERIPWNDYKLHICSINNFPTAAGLASSAAGFACLGLFDFYEDLTRQANLTFYICIEMRKFFSLCFCTTVQY
jgi:mevalonate pyrophosphate decarboxylase